MAKIYIPLSEDRIPMYIKEKLSFDDGYYFEDSKENREFFNEYMPYGFRKDIERLQIDLIPKTSWGASLAGSLTPSSWSALRKPFIEKNGNRCQLCGQRGKAVSKSIQDVDSHEVWSYEETSDGKKIQKLKGMLSLCSSCHLMFHLGFAKVDGKFDLTKRRLQRMEQLTDEEISIRINEIFKTWERRSAFEWEIDISILKECGFTDIKFKPKFKKEDFKI